MALPSYFPIIIIGGVLSLIGITFFLVYLYEKKRSEAIRDIAMRIGFSFTKKVEKSFLMSLPEFVTFKKGHSRKVSNLMKGSKNGVSWSIFDYRYTVGGGKNSHTYNQTVAFASLNINLPNFSLTKENFFHKIGNIFGYKDIDFDNFPDFSKNYFLKGEDEQSIRSIFTPELLNYFQNNPTILNVEANKNYLLYYKLSKRSKPEELISFIAEAAKIVRLFDKKEF